MSSSSSDASVPWLVGPATGEVESLALPTGRRLCEVEVQIETASEAPLGSRDSRDDEVPATSNVPRISGISTGDSIAILHDIQRSLRQLLIEVHRELQPAAPAPLIGVQLHGIDQWLVDQRLSLFAHISHRIAIAAVALDKLRAEAPGLAASRLSDEQVAKRAAESVVGSRRSPFFEHWAHAALSKRPTLAATYPSESPISCEAPARPTSLLVLADTSVGALPAQHENASTAKPLAIRRVRASRSDATLLAGEPEALLSVFRDATCRTAVMSVSVASYPLQGAVEGLTATSIPGVFLLPDCTPEDRTQRALDIELTLRAHATSFNVFQDESSS